MTEGRERPTVRQLYVACKKCTFSAIFFDWGARLFATNEKFNRHGNRSERRDAGRYDCPHQPGSTAPHLPKVGEAIAQGHEKISSVLFEAGTSVDQSIDLVITYPPLAGSMPDIAGVWPI